MNSQKINRLREAMQITPALCIERAYLMTQSYKETEGMHGVIRRAKALDKILREMTIYIDEDELIVGRATTKRKAGPLIPEVQWVWYLEELDSMSTRETDKIQEWTEEEKIKLKEILDYWNGKSLYDKWWPNISEDYQKLLNRSWLPGPANPIAGFHLAHCCPGFERVLNGGFKSIKQKVEEESRKLKMNGMEGSDEFSFLLSVGICLDAVIAFAERYADLSENLAKKETDAQRKAELQRISKVCERIPANPARTFYEAMQSLWFVYLSVMLEGYGPGIGFGRIDQYLYPFYKKDMDEGLITREEVQELIGLFYIKTNELVMPFPSKFNSGSGQNPLSVLTIGGVNQRGKDAVNELSYLFIEAEKDVRLQEDIAIRFHKNTPPAFLLKASEVAKLVRGKIKFVSDETITQQLLNDGKPIEYARDYAITGCFIRTVPGRSYDTGGEALSLPFILELALNNGKSRLTGDQVGPSTGDPKDFQSYEEVWDAYKKQVATLIQYTVSTKNFSWQLISESLQVPLQSSLFEGCVEKATDITNNGTAPYTTAGMWITGIPTVGDSLAAVKKIVFEDRSITMSELIEALGNNFEDREDILKALLSAPKFGNDDDYVDSIVEEVLIHFSNELVKFKGHKNVKYTLAAGSVGNDIVFGKGVGALPDGRKAGLPLSDGGISPYYGRDVSGPTSTMRSVAKLDLVKSSGGNVLNMKFNPDLLKDENKMRKFISLLQTFGETGGDLVQFNIVSGDMLRDAQKNPEKYKDLLVRVATYSAYFVELTTELQNQIIARTEFQEV